MPKLIMYTVFGFCHYMCILLLLVRVYWLFFVFYLIGCKTGFCGPRVRLVGILERVKSLLFVCFVVLLIFVIISYCFICSIISFLCY